MTHFSGFEKEVVVERQAKVRHLCPVLLRDEHVSRGQVSVYHLARLQVLHTLAGITVKRCHVNNTLNFLILNVQLTVRI